MDSKEFTQQAMRTESTIYNQQNPRILHAAMGLVTESAELMDAVKKASFYGRDLDIINILEESGDILWYLAILYNELGSNFESEMSRVINKLQSRFPEKFTKENAYDRDLEKERAALEFMSKG